MLKSISDYNINKMSNKKMEGIPKIKRIKNSIVNLPNVNDSLKDLIMLCDFNSEENKNLKEFNIQFRQFSKFSRESNIYQIKYRHKPCEEDLLYLLFALKYSCKDIYKNKRLIMSCIYEPFLSQKYEYDNFTLIENKSDNLLNEHLKNFKGGVYDIKECSIENKKCYIIAGYMLVLYQKDEFGEKNILSNDYEHLITAVNIIYINKAMYIVTGAKSAIIRFYKVNSFHEVQYLNSFFKHFGSPINNIFTSSKMDDINAYYFIVDEISIQLWKNLGEEVLFKYNIEKKDKHKIICSDYLYDSQEEENKIVYADTNFELNLINIKNEKFYNFNKDKDINFDKLELNLFKKKQITSVKFYKNKKYNYCRTLFIGNVDMIIVYDFFEKEINSYFPLFDTILFIEYYISNSMLYLFCSGKNSLHLLHFKE